MKTSTINHKLFPGGITKRFLMLAGLLLTQSCDNNATDPVNVYDYYPLEIGRYQIYEVKEQIYSAGQKNPVLLSYQEKDEIERVSADGQGGSTYVYSRSTRKSSTDYWQKVKEFSVTRYPDKLLTNIDNQTFFSLIFPVDARITWNGNAYNNLDEEDYHYEDLNGPGKVGALHFDKTLTVVERKDTSIINRYVGIKQYGLGTGLISDDQTIYEYCQNDACIGSGTIESGTRRTRTIMEFGKK